MKRTELGTMAHAGRGAWLAVHLALAWGLAGLLAGAEPRAAAAEPQALRVIVYNVQFLPGVASIANKRKQPAYRAQRLGEVLAAYDIVGLNEVFEDRPREAILAGLKAAWGDNYSAVAISKPADGRFNGGLAIATRRPLVATHEMVFSVSSSPKKYGVGADGFAAKGVLHARIARTAEAGSDFVDVFCTHLESKEDELRPTQYRELAQFVRQHASADHPVLILGDMNTRGNAADVDNPQSAYHQMLSIYQEGRGQPPLKDAWIVAGQGPPGTGEQENSEDGGNRIDYIFFSNPLVHERLLPRRVVVERFLDPQTVALSDHNAVQADFTWRP